MIIVKILIVHILICWINIGLLKCVLSNHWNYYVTKEDIIMAFLPIVNLAILIWGIGVIINNCLKYLVKWVSNE